MKRRGNIYVHAWLFCAIWSHCSSIPMYNDNEGRAKDEVARPRTTIEDVEPYRRQQLSYYWRCRCCYNSVVSV